MDVRTDWIAEDDMAVVLRLLTPANRNAVELSLVSGLRISDVLDIRTDALEKGQRLSVHEHKTGKTKRVYIPKKLYERLRSDAGEEYIFEGRNNKHKPRTRQAVWLDIKRAAKALRIKDNLAPHSARKIYAVQVYREKGLKAAQKALNHDRPETTLIYIMSELCR